MGVITLLLVITVPFVAHGWFIVSAARSMPGATYFLPGAGPVPGWARLSPDAISSAEHSGTTGLNEFPEKNCTAKMIRNNPFEGITSKQMIIHIPFERNVSKQMIICDPFGRNAIKQMIGHVPFEGNTIKQMIIHNPFERNASKQMLCHIPFEGKAIKQTICLYFFL